MSDHDPARESAWDALLEWTRTRHPEAWGGPVATQAERRLDLLRQERQAFETEHPEHVGHLPCL